MNTKNEYQKKLKFIKKHLNISNETLAKGLDVTLGTVNRWLARTSIPAPHNANKIDDLYGMVKNE